CRRDREAAEATAAEVRALGRRACALQADVGEREAVEAMVAHAVEFLGGLDVAVANSGVAARVATVAKTDPAEWRRVLATDLDGAFWTARAAIPHVVARKGVFLFISSIGADAAQARGGGRAGAGAGAGPGAPGAGAGRAGRARRGGRAARRAGAGGRAGPPRAPGPRRGGGGGGGGRGPGPACRGGRGGAGCAP